MRPPLPAGSPATIRPARTADLPAVQALLAATWHHTYDRWLGCARVARITEEWHSIARLSEQLDAPATAFLVAELRGAFLATGFAHAIGAHDVEIGRLYVAPHAQRHGIGARLLQALLGAFPLSCRFYLEVEPRNAGAIRFYERHGFVRGGSVQGGGAHGAGIAAIAMQLTRPA